MPPIGDLPGTIILMIAEKTDTQLGPIYYWQGNIQLATYGLCVVCITMSRITFTISGIKVTTQKATLEPELVIKTKSVDYLRENLSYMLRPQLCRNEWGIMINGPYANRSKEAPCPNP